MNYLTKAPVGVFTKRKKFTLSIVSRLGDDATEVKFN